MIRFTLVASAIALLSGCDAEKEEPACCAIEPKAKCESQLAGLGLSPEERKALTGFDRLCPVSVMTMDRIRELDAKWPQDCRSSGISSPLALLDDNVSCPNVTLEALDVPLGVDASKWNACGAGLTARGLRENELWVIMHDPTSICPNVGVTEARIREIIANDWEAAGCTHAKPIELLSAMDSGRCGGDAD